MAARTRGKTFWLVAGLIVFILADLALVGYALSDGSSDSGSSTTEPIFTPSPASSAIPSTPVPSTPVTTTPVPTAAIEPTPPPTTPGSVAPTPSAPPTGSAAPTAVPPTPAAGALTGMADPLVGYRATPGSCTGSSTSTDSVIELTTDGGATWSPITPTDIRIRAVEKLVVVDASHVDLLARYGDSCTESAISTYTQGEFWKTYPDRTTELK